MQQHCMPGAAAQTVCVRPSRMHCLQRCRAATFLIPRRSICLCAIKGVCELPMARHAVAVPVQLHNVSLKLLKLCCTTARVATPQVRCWTCCTPTPRQRPTPPCRRSSCRPARLGCGASQPRSRPPDRRRSGERRLWSCWPPGCACWRCWRSAARCPAVVLRQSGHNFWRWLYGLGTDVRQVGASV